MVRRPMYVQAMVVVVVVVYIQQDEAFLVRSEHGAWVAHDGGEA